MSALRSLLRALASPRGSLLVSGAAGAGLALACYGAYRDGRGARHYRDILQEGAWPRRGILVPVSAAKEAVSVPVGM